MAKDLGLGLENEKEVSPESIEAKPPKEEFENLDLRKN